MVPLGVYIHIPFCVKKCLYCDFVSYAGKKADIPKYFEALQDEMKWYLQNQALKNYDPYTLYIGGGTPSLTGFELERLLTSNWKFWPLETLSEVTVEVNPGTASLLQLKQLHLAGITRLSIGVQSFENRELQELGRIHTAEEALNCFSEAREAGFTNLNLDLMFGIPGSTLSTWEASLRKAISLAPEHIAVYNLTIETGTPFGERWQKGDVFLPDEETQLTMYELGRTLLFESGYEQYEISNFARPGYRSQHNQIYWRNMEYLGLGAGAHSYLAGYRYWNIADIDAYITKIGKRTQDTAIEKGRFAPVIEGYEQLTRSRRMGETVMMNLRLMEGIDLSAFRKRFGQTLESCYSSEIAKFTTLGLLEIQDNHLRLTSQGVMLSNEVFQEFINNR